MTLASIEAYCTGDLSDRQANTLFRGLAVAKGFFALDAHVEQRGRNLLDALGE